MTISFIACMHLDFSKRDDAIRMLSVNGNMIHFFSEYNNPMSFLVCKDIGIIEGSCVCHSKDSGCINYKPKSYTIEIPYLEINSYTLDEYKSKSILTGDDK